MRQVILSDRQYRDIVRDTWEAVLEINKPPTIFIRGEMPVRVVSSREGPKIDILNPDKMFGVAINACDFVTINTKTGSHPAKPTQELAKTMVVLPSPQLPALEGLSATPLFTPSGKFCATNGYNEELRTQFYGMENLRLPPSSDNLDSALALVREVFCDFPYQENEFAHLLATLLCPVCTEGYSGGHTHPPCRSKFARRRKDSYSRDYLSDRNRRKTCPNCPVR